ncbi:hypothetical protein G4B88_020121 [Cannabis sativa]|uniref:BHLH domain-containing protein n=1 Tax=Cannabis sativa TaxID=3483 RepID=A0A7J6E744_CANSA|nr:hypothetical protein G4B88_020121 [Cannabis sativa]
MSLYTTYMIILDQLYITRGRGTLDNIDLEGFGDLWLLESTPISPCDELNVNPIDLQQEVSAFAELLSNINDINGILQQNTKASSHYQDSNFPTIHDPCHETSHIFDVEQGNNICTSYTIPQIDSNSLLVNNDMERISFLSDDKKSKYDEKQLRVQPEVIEDLMVKKQDHNAKEKIRRMKLSETYMALGSLLPTNSRPSKVLTFPVVGLQYKKKWTAPIIIDEVLEYIPEIEKEIKQLTLKKEDMLSTIDNMQSFINKNNMNNQYSEVDFFTISVNEVKKNLEFILQIICMQRDHGMSLLSGLLQSMEYEGLFLISASTLHICDERVCYNIHLQKLVEFCEAQCSDVVGNSQLCDVHSVKTLFSCSMKNESSNSIMKEEDCSLMLKEKILRHLYLDSMKTTTISVSRTNIYIHHGMENYSALP